jgi:hypothetical protein
MADAESLRQIAHSRTPFSAWLGVILLFALFGVIVLAIIGPAPRGDSYEQNRAKAREEKLKKVREEDAAALASYAWADKDKGIARLPITRAMELTVAELAAKKPQLAGPIATPVAQAAASPGAVAPTPAPAPSPSPAGTPKATSVAGPSSVIGTQPAAAANPPAASPGTQPGAAATPAASPGAPPAKPAVSPSPVAVPSPPGSPLPVRAKTPEIP